MPIDKPFAYHKPSPEGEQKIADLRQSYSVVLAAIQKNCPDSRQKAVAITELETSAMWAIKAVVFADPGSEVEEGPQASPSLSDRERQQHRGMNPYQG